MIHARDDGVGNLPWFSPIFLHISDTNAFEQSKKIVGWLRVGVDDVLLFLLMLNLEVFTVNRAISPTLAI